MKEFFSSLQSKDVKLAFSTYLVILLAVIVVFFVIREVVTWYYKINRIVELLESIDERLNILSQPPSSGPMQSIAESNEKKESSFTTRTKDILTKEYHFKDLFSNKKDNDT